MRPNQLILALIPSLLATLALGDCPSSESQFWKLMQISVTKISKYKETVDSKFLTKISERIEACAPQINQAPQCTTNLLKFAKTYAQRQGAGNRYGFMVSDQTYISNPKVKSMIQLPEEFKNGLPSNWKEIADKKGWKYIEYGSSLVGAYPYYSHRRIAMLIASSQKDLWIQFIIPESPNAFREWSFGKNFLGVSLDFSERIINIIAVEKASQNPDAKNKIYYAELIRGLAVGREPKVHTGVTSCYECHSNGMRNIVPALGTMDPIYRNTLRELNERMDEYGPFDWSDKVKIENLGPALGKGQSCIGCHNNYNDESSSGYSRGHLNYYANSDHIKSKMIDLAHMPPELLRDQGYEDLKKSLELMDQLSFTERAEHKKNIAGLIFLSRASLWDPTQIVNRGRTEYEIALKFLLEKNRVTQVTYDKAMIQLKNLRQKQTIAYQRLMTSYQKELARWLWPKANCPQEK